jgi:hypothetical protein
MTQLTPNNYTQNIDGQVTMTSTFTMEFSGPNTENPFMNSYEQNQEEFVLQEGVLDAIQAAFPGSENEVIQVFNSASSFSELARDLCEHFEMNGWSAAIGDYTMSVSLIVSVNYQ